MRTLVPIGVVAAALVLPSTAEAKPCGVVRVDGGWVVAKGDSRWDRKVSCRRARSIARRYIRTRDAPRGWRCRHSRAVKRCVRGGTYVDEFGNRLPRYSILWHRPD
jgi:hypothetical protein